MMPLRSLSARSPATSQCRVGLRSGRNVLGRRPVHPPPRCTAGDGPSDAPVPGPVGNADELPEELRDLAINEDGLLIDSKTGKVINQLGATRFDVAVRALRGELDPPEWVENSERTPGVILSALMTFPKPYIFQVVGRPEQGGSAIDPAASFAQDVAATVTRVCQVPAEEATCEVKPRMGGKYVSVSVECLVRAPEIIANVYDALGADPRVMMKF